MATYYANAAGSSTPPYDTPEKGVPTIEGLRALVTLQHDDEIVVIGTINETSSDIHFYPTRVNVRGIDENNKGVVNLINGGRFTTYQNSYTDLWMISAGTRTVIIQNDGLVERCFVENTRSNPGSEDFAVLFNGSAGNRLMNSIVRSNPVCLGSSNATSKAFNNIFHKLGGSWPTVWIGYGGDLFLYNNILLLENGGQGIRAHVPVYAPDMHNDYNCLWGSTDFLLWNNGIVQGANEIKSDPLLADPMNYDYTYQGTSPCIDTGAGVSIDSEIPTNDYLKTVRPQESPTVPNVTDGTDIGPYELTIIPPYYNEIEGGNTIDVSSGDVSIVSTLYPLKFAILPKVSSDPNFANPSQWQEAIVYYKHETTNHTIKIAHSLRGSDWIGYSDVSQFAEPGTWLKERAILIDKENDSLTLDRIDLGTEEDLTITN